MGLAQGLVIHNVHRLAGRGHRIFAGKASGAEPAAAVNGQLLYMLHTQVPQGIGPHQLADFLHGVAGGNQVFLIGDVGAEIAGVR